MKQCKKCGEIKLETEFYKYPRNKDGLYGICKVCHNKQNKEYSKKWRKNNPERIREVNKKWRKNNPEYQRKWRKNNLKKAKKHSEKWKENNLEKIKETKRIWGNNNPKKVKKYRKKQYKKLSKIPSYRISKAISRGINYSLKGNKNGRSWETLVGYTKEELMRHIESKFEPWMNWDNYGIYEKGKLKWVIDHWRPVSSFNFTSTDDPEFKECWALENLQPLEVVENIKKSNKYK